MNKPIALRRSEARLPERTKHEVIIRFPRAQKQIILELLRSSFSEVKIVQNKTGQYLLAHCFFQGDLKRLDQELKALQSKAVVVCGEKSEEGILEFFIEISEIVRPQPLLGEVKKPSQKFSPLIMLLLAAIFIGGGLWGGPKLLSLIESRMETRQITVHSINPWTKALSPSWNKFVIPQHQEGWLVFQREFRLSDKLMLELFKNIKDVGQYGHGQLYNDLTIYPEVMSRAVGLLVLQNVRNFEDFSRLTEEIRLKYLYSRAFPDEEKEYVNALSPQQENGIILSFYEDVLLKNQDFTKMLIRESRKGAYG